MSLNYEEINLILKELNLEGSRVNKVNQPDKESLFFEFYKDKQKQFVEISLTHGSVRLNRIQSKPPFPPYPLRFAQLLRSKISGTKIISAEQPGNERLIRFHFRTQKQNLFLWIRLWSGNSNLILTDENSVIIDTLIRKPALNEISRKKFNPDRFIRKDHKIKTVREYDEKIDFNNFIDEFFSNEKNEDQFQQLKDREIKKTADYIGKLAGHIKTLQKRMERYQNFHIYKNMGELILSNLHKINKGDCLFVTENYYSQNEQVEILLKPEKNPQENSELYFKKYKKYQSGLEIVQLDIQLQKGDLDKLSNKMKDLISCESPAKLESLIKKTEPTQTVNEKKQLGLHFNSSGYNIFVGRNSKENDQLLRRKARGNDMWLHIRDYPGGFVFIRTLKGKSIPLNVLLDAANLALLYSSKKYKDKAEILYTKVKNLRRVKDGKLGMVLANNEKNLSITYDEKRIKKLQQKTNLLERNLLNNDN